MIPPCGSPLKTMMKSVSLAVSGLAASSEMIRDDRGETMPYLNLGRAFYREHRGARPMQIAIASAGMCSRA